MTLESITWTRFGTPWSKDLVRLSDSNTTLQGASLLDFQVGHQKCTAKDTVRIRTLLVRRLRTQPGWPSALPVGELGALRALHREGLQSERFVDRECSGARIVRGSRSRCGAPTPQPIASGTRKPRLPHVDWHERAMPILEAVQ